MIVFDRNKKEIKVPEGLGNINITVLDATMEDVVANITAIETTILPSPGYNGMSSVEVNAQSVYDNGYNEGETDQKAKLTGITITENGTYSREDGYNEITVDVPDLNGDYNEGYEAGKVDGYEQGNIAGYENGFVEGNATGYANGVNDGKAEQKALLEPITITENGVYSTEDGYSEVTVNIEDTTGSYDVGYSDGYEAGIEEGTANAGEIIAETARVLNITKNGQYLSKYSEPVYPTEITGIYPDGTEFYNYANLSNKSYNTGILSDNDTKVELWWCGDITQNDNAIIGWQSNGNFKVCVVNNYYNSNSLNGEINFNAITKQNLESNVWYHIELSKQEGFKINGELIGTFEGVGNINNSNIHLNTINGGNCANGKYGMIKINDTVIIPTADGFLNTNTGELLEVIQEGAYIFTDNIPQVPEGNLIKTVNVNVIPKIDISKEGIKFGNSTFSTVPEWADLSNVIDFSYLFNSCLNIQILSELPTHNATIMNHIFDNCTRLTIAPVMSTNKVTDVSYMFWQCAALQQIPTYDFSNVTNISYMFRYSFQGNMDKLTDVGGFIGLSCNWGDDYGLAICSNLTYQSCINILNGLADVTELGSRTLKVHQNFLTTVGDEISIGTNKGWTITA